MDGLTREHIELIILFVAPGFISLKVWGLLHSSPRFRLSESLIEAVIYSGWNSVFFLWLFSTLKNISPALAYGIVYIVLPVIWPVLLNWLVKIPYFRTRITPTAWDHLFNDIKACYILLHLKNGDLLGGVYRKGSFASAYPEKEDLFISELWKVDGKGVFKSKVENSGGVLVNSDEIRFIETFKLNGSSLAKNKPGQIPAE